jgi:hypothetical protein
MPPIGDGWFEAEEPIGVGMVTELQRIRRRTRVRPIPVLLLAIVVTALVTYKFASKPKLYEASVVLAMQEGSLASPKNRHIPFDQLRAYVVEVLMPDKPILAMIERHDLFPLRKKLGPQFALNELRDALEVQIWKNSFVHYAEEDSEALKSARIGIEVTSEDPDVAYTIARELATIAIAQHDARRKLVAEALSGNVALTRDSIAQRLDELAAQRLAKQTEMIAAQRDGKPGLAGALLIDIAAIAHEEKRVMTELDQVAASPDALADQITAAGLDTTLSIVDERRPLVAESSGLVLAMIIVVIGVGALIGSALFVGAFDARVHEVDDVTRLGLPILGHVPGFPGDHIGSLASRGVKGTRVPSFLRWRFLR